MRDDILTFFLGIDNVEIFNKYC